MDRNRFQPHGGDLPETYGGGDISGGRGKMPEFLAELAQLFCGDLPLFGLEAFSVLLAQMFDHCEIRAAFGSIKTFPDLRQNEMAGLPDLGTVSVDGDHQAVSLIGWCELYKDWAARHGNV